MELVTSIWCTDARYADRESGYYISDVDMSDQGWVKVKNVVISFDPPPADVVNQAVVMQLKQKREMIQREFLTRLEEINDEIKKYEAITYEAPTV